jgi:hypothetical protein
MAPKVCTKKIILVGIVYTYVHFRVRLFLDPSLIPNDTHTRTHIHLLLSFFWTLWPSVGHADDDDDDLSFPRMDCTRRSGVELPWKIKGFLPNDWKKRIKSSRPSTVDRLYTTTTRHKPTPIRPTFLERFWQRVVDVKFQPFVTREGRRRRHTKLARHFIHSFSFAFFLGHFHPVSTFTKGRSWRYVLRVLVDDDGMPCCDTRSILSLVPMK